MHRTRETIRLNTKIQSKVLIFRLCFSAHFFRENSRGRHAGANVSGASKPINTLVCWAEFLIKCYLDIKFLNFLGVNPLNKAPIYTGIFQNWLVSTIHYIAVYDMYSILIKIHNIYILSTWFLPFQERAWCWWWYHSIWQIVSTTIWPDF